MNNRICGPGASIALLCSGHMLIDFYNNFLPVLLPFIMVKLDMSLTMCGLLVMVLSITANLMQPFLGYLFDKRDLSKTLLFAIPLCGVFICVIGYVPNKLALFILCALLGLTVSAFHPLGSSLLGKVSQKTNMGRAMSLFVAGGNIGFAAAPVLVMAFMSRFSIETMPLMAIPGIVLGIMYWLAGIHKVPSSGNSSKDIQNEASIKDILKNGSVLKLNFAMGFRCWTHVAIVTFLPMLMIAHGYSPMLSGVLSAVFLAGSAIGGLAGGELGDHFHHKWVMVISLFLALFPVVYFFNEPSTEPMAVLALFLAGALLQAPQPSSIVWTGQLMPRFIGMASGMMMGLCFGIGSIGAAVTAAVGEKIGLNPALLLSVIPTFIALLLVLSTPYEQSEF